MARSKSSVTEILQDSNALHPKDTLLERVSVAVDNFADLSLEAKNATDQEHSMGFLEAVKLYPKAIGWHVNTHDLEETSLIM